MVDIEVKAELRKAAAKKGQATRAANQRADEAKKEVSSNFPSQELMDELYRLYEEADNLSAIGGGGPISDAAKLAAAALESAYASGPRNREEAKVKNALDAYN